MAVRNVKTTVISGSNDNGELTVVDDPRLAVIKLSITLNGIDNLSHTAEINVLRSDIPALIASFDDSEGSRRGV